MKKEYLAPQLTTEKIQIGVFGEYGKCRDIVQNQILKFLGRFWSRKRFGR